MARILVIDDERSIRITLREFLIEVGHTVEITGEANEALSMIDRYDYDVVITDIILPDISGIEILNQIRQRMPNTQVIIITGEPTIDTAAQAVRSGAFDYLPKPITEAEIKSAVSRALNVKALMDEKKRLEIENRNYQERLEELVNLRTEALSKSEEKYRNLFETMLTGVIYLNDEEKITAANPAAGRIFGSTLEQMQGKTPAELLIKPIRHDGSLFPMEELPCRVALKTRKNIANVMIGARTVRSKKYHWTIVNAVPQFKEGQDQPEQVFLTFDDITSLKETEAALLKSEEKNRAMLNVLPDVMIRFKNDGTILDFQNPQGSAFPFQPQIGINIDELLPASFCELSRHFLQAALSSRQMQKYDYQFSIHDETHHFEARLVMSGSDEGLVILRDVTEQKRFEYDLQKSEKKFRILLESASQAILLVDIHGQIVLVNAQLEKVFGYQRDELINQQVEILLPAALRDSHVLRRNVFFTHPISREMGAGFNVTARRKDGSEFPVEIGLSAVEIYEGIFVMAFITDISERKKLENKLRQVEKLEAIGQLAGGIAHDFNNVLAGIMGLSELTLRKTNQDNPAVETLKIIIKKSESAANLVRQLLTFSRKQVISAHLVNLNQSILSNAKLLQRYLGEDIRLVTLLDDELHLIYADATAIDQIITNLCINARDAMPDGGELFLETQNVSFTESLVTQMGEMLAGRYVKLSVIDGGVGMRQEIMKHIFEPFFTTKDIGEGTGLGLSIVYGLVQQHHAFIQCESKLGEGTTFDIFFPAATDAALNHSEKKNHQIKGGHETILVVEDEADLLKGFKDALENVGYRVLTADHGGSALSLFERFTPEIDLIISDVVMPYMGGVELNLRIQKINPRIKFLFMSAYNDKMEEGRNYLQKPFQSEVLLHRVRDILDNNL